MDYYKASEAQYKDLFDNAHDLIYFATTDGRLLYVNKAWARVLEYEPSELQGKLIFEIVEESALDKFLTYRKAILEGRDADKDIIITVKTKSGKKIYLEGFVSLKLREGNPLYTQGIFRDVTQRLENEAKLKSINEKLLEREHNLQQLLLNAPDAVIVIDHESKIRFWNPKAAHIFGWTQDEVIGESLAEKIIPHQHKQAHELGMKRFLLTGVAHVINRTIEITALRKNGEEFYVSLTISTTRQNGAVAFIAFLRDITEQKSNGLKLEEKTRQLEVSNQQLEQFAHIASHDMKEPIRKAIMYSGMLQTEFDHLLPDKGKLYLNKVQTANDRLSKMVEGILTYSGISSNQEPVETIELKQILDSIMNDLELIIHKKNAEISFNSLPEFEGVPFLIYQLFYNLISNSLKFSKPGVAPVINITGRMLGNEEIFKLNKLNNNTQWVEISLKDNGIGFRQEFALKIFGTFERLHSRQVYEGTGLGLSLCKNIVERHHGSITAYGEEDIGADFRILLPKMKINE